jgi:predicted phage baseplate assembly protein
VIAVRELLGPRADVEWRILARALFGDPAVIARLEALLGAEVTQADVVLGPLRLVRDRRKRVTEAWVEWEGRRDLRSSGPGDRHHAVDRARGLLFFGDGDEGMIPPLGAAISAVRYQTGGGEAGNVAAHAISQLVGPIGGVESAQNPVPAEGGADRESLETLALRGPRRLRARGRAVTPQDYEAMAREADPAVAVATAFPCRDPAGRRRAAWLTLVIIPRTTDPRPWPSFGLREAVRAFVAARADAALSAEDRIFVTGPDYQAVDVSTTLVPLDPSQAGAVDAAARQALLDFLHPLHGGKDGRGFGAGASVWLSDLAEVLARVPGVDQVRELFLLLDGALQGTSITIGAGRVAVAGDLSIRITEP